MPINEINNNHCELSGTVFSDITLSHEIYGEKFYTFVIKTERLSGVGDLINVIFSKNCIGSGIKRGDFISVKGQFRSYNNPTGEGSRLVLSVFAKEMATGEEIGENVNHITLNGFLCKPPVYRLTPFGREITDILLAVNRIHNKSDYIPCIIWGIKAREASSLCVGDRLTVYGRIQSREYKKKTDDGETLVKTAYEVSVGRFEI